MMNQWDIWFFIRLTSLDNLQPKSGQNNRRLMWAEKNQINIHGSEDNQFTYRSIWNRLRGQQQFHIARTYFPDVQANGLRWIRHRTEWKIFETNQLILTGILWSRGETSEDLTDSSSWENGLQEILESPCLLTLHLHRIRSLEILRPGSFLTTFRLTCTNRDNYQKSKPFYFYDLWRTKFVIVRQVGFNLTWYFRLCGLQETPYKEMGTFMTRVLWWFPQNHFGHS